MTVTHEPVLLQPRIEEFLTYCGARNDSPNTIRSYRRGLADFVASLGADPTATDISRKAVRAFTSQIYEAGRARSTTRLRLAAVRSFCKWLESEDLIEAGLIESLKSPRRRQELPDVPTEEELRQLLRAPIPSASPERDLVILELLYGSGLRAAELVGVNVDDFHEEDALVIRGKGRKERYVILGEYARAAVKAWRPVRAGMLKDTILETPALLFSVGPHRSAERLDVRSVGRIVKAVAAAQGLDAGKWHPHLLRHACGTHMHDHSAPLQAVATFLGHAKLSTAQIYTRVSVGRMMQSYNAAHPQAGSHCCTQED